MITTTLPFIYPSIRIGCTSSNIENFSKHYEYNIQYYILKERELKIASSQGPFNSHISIQPINQASHNIFKIVAVASDFRYSIIERNYM